MRSMQSMEIDKSGLSSLDPPVKESDCLLYSIKKAIARDMASVIEVGGNGRIWIDPLAGQYWQEVSDPESFFATGSRLAKMERCEVPAGRHSSGPLEELLWDAAFMGSKGRLFKGTQLDDLVELSWWPNLTRVAHFQSTFALCAFLFSRPSTMHLALRALGVSEQEAVRFYNAGLVSGCVKILRSRSEGFGHLKGVESGDAKSDGQARVPFWRRLFSKVSEL